MRSKIRHAILCTLKRGPATGAELELDVGATHDQVVREVIHLEAEGFVESDVHERQAVDKPAPRFKECVFRATFGPGAAPPAEGGPG